MISFIGQAAAKAIAAHSDVVHAVIRYCALQDHRRIEVHVNEREGSEALEWPIIIRGDHGQRTVAAIQNYAGAVVRFVE